MPKATPTVQIGDVLQAVGDDGEVCTMFGGFDPDDPEVVERSDDMNLVAKWLQDPSVTLTPAALEIARVQLADLEKFRQGAKVFIHAVVDQMKADARREQEDISRCISKHEDFAHGKAVGTYFQACKDAQLVADIISAAHLELGKRAKGD